MLEAPPRRHVATWGWWVGFAVVASSALYLTIVAYREGLPAVFSIERVDKLAHFGFAGSMAFFLDGALRQRTLFVVGTLAVPLAAAAILVPTGVEEYFQRYATFRTSSFWDFAADVAGVVVLIPLSRRVSAMFSSPA